MISSNLIVFKSQSNRKVKSLLRIPVSDISGLGIVDPGEQLEGGPLKVGDLFGLRRRDVDDVAAETFSRVDRLLQLGLLSLAP